MPRIVIAALWRKQKVFTQWCQIVFQMVLSMCTPIAVYEFPLNPRYFNPWYIRILNFCQFSRYKLVSQFSQKLFPFNNKIRLGIFCVWGGKNVTWDSLFDKIVCARHNCYTVELYNFSSFMNETLYPLNSNFPFSSPSSPGTNHSLSASINLTILDSLYK